MLPEIQNENVLVHGGRTISSEGETLPKLLRKNFLMHPDQVAMRVKDRGIWQGYTWKDCYEKVRFFCMGMISLGLKRGDKVSVLGENKPEWYWAELAVQAAGGTAVGIFTDCIPSEVKYFAEHSDSKFVIAHDQEQVDKLLEIGDELHLLKKIIYWDPKGLWNYRNSILMSFEEVIEIGRAYDKDDLGLFEENIDQGNSGDIAAICYTSGTTGVPKGALISHWYLIEGQRELSKLQGWFGKKGYQYLSFLPPAWVSEQISGIAGWLATQLIVNFPEEPETVQENLREIGPHSLMFGARQWESLNRMVQAKMKDSTFSRRLIYRTFLPLGFKVADIYIDGRKPNLFWRFLYFIAYQAIIRQLRDRLGLTNAKVVLTGGGAISPEIIRYFKALGIDIMLFYGSTEAGIVSLPRVGEIRPETSGRVAPWADLKLSDDGEILTKNKFMFSGYYKNPKATHEKFKDGWYCTGDFGYIDKEGFLIVIDRMEDLKPLGGGKNFPPSMQRRGCGSAHSSRTSSLLVVSREHM